MNFIFKLMNSTLVDIVNTFTIDSRTTVEIHTSSEIKIYSNQFSKLDEVEINVDPKNIDHVKVTTTETQSVTPDEAINIVQNQLEVS